MTELKPLPKKAINFEMVRKTLISEIQVIAETREVKGNIQCSSEVLPQSFMKLLQAVKVPCYYYSEIEKNI